MSRCAFLACFCLLGGVGCGRSALYEDVDEPAPMVDAGPRDFGAADAGRDAGQYDAGRPDAGPADGGAPDAGPADAGPLDAGVPDAGPLDAGTGDAGVPVCPFTLGATVVATLSLTADNHRTVWVNGLLVEATDNEWYQPTRLTITLARHPSVENVIAVEAVNLSSQAGFDRGLLLDVRLDSGAVVVSDRSWRAASTSDGGWSPADVTWRQPGFDDRTWPMAIEQAPNGAAPWGLTSLVAPQARWIWSYLSNVPLKPNVEAVLFRRSLFVTLDGGLADGPSPCP